MVSEMGLEPTQISPYAPETYVSTIPPLRLVGLAMCSYTYSYITNII